MKVLTFFNNKGGVGKTTLAVNVASFIKMHYDKRILFIDADPQANSTQMMIPEERWDQYYGEEASSPTLKNLFANIVEGNSDVSFTDEFFNQGENRFLVDLIPGHPSLSIVEDILSDAWNKCLGGDLGGFRRTNWLKMVKEHYKESYDYIFIDVGPSLGALNRSILINTDYIITPMGSDIFSLIGVSNISTWIKSWVQGYKNGITPLFEKYERNSIEKYDINLDIDSSAKLIGFSIQQYVTKTFKEGRRPVASYDQIVKKVPSVMQQHLSFLFLEGLTIENLNLGDVPYLYSLVPLAQSCKAPMYDLKGTDGVRGNLVSSVKTYKGMLEVICNKIMINIGDKDVD